MQFDDMEFEVSPEEAQSGSIYVPVDLIFQELNERGFLIYNTEINDFQFEAPTSNEASEMAKRLIVLIKGKEEAENV